MASVTGLTGGWSEGITSSQWQDRRSCDEIILGKTGPTEEWSKRLTSSQWKGRSFSR